MATIPDLEKHLTPALLRQREEMMAKRGLATLGFYEQLMAYPELFQRFEALGTFVRFESALPARLREIVVLMVAVELRSPFEWDTHQATSAAAGVTPRLLAAIASRGPLDEDLEDLRGAVRCVTGQKSVPQPLFDRLIARHGVPAAVEVIALAAMYRMYAALGAAFDSRMPDR